MARAKADRPEQADLLHPLPDRRRHGEENDHPRHDEEQRRDAERKFVKVVHGLHLELHGLFYGHDPRARQNGRYLRYDVADRAAAAERRQLNEADGISFPEALLDPPYVGEEKTIVLRPRAVEDAGDAELVFPERKDVAGRDLELGCRVPAEQDVPAPVRLHSRGEPPPFLESEFRAEIHAGDQHLPALDLRHHEQLRRHRADVLVVLYGAYLPLIIRRQHPAAGVHGGNGKAAVRQGKVFRSGKHEDIRAELIERMHDFPVHGFADGGKGDGGPDADREARYEKEGPPLFPADVVYGYFDQIHRSSLVRGPGQPCLHPRFRKSRVLPLFWTEGTVFPCVTSTRSTWSKRSCSIIKNTSPRPRGPLPSAPRPVRQSSGRAGWGCIRR